MERHDRTPGSRNRGRAQITQICAHTSDTLTRQPAAQIGGYVRDSIMDRCHTK
jgi:hypothetical protein